MKPTVASDMLVLAGGTLAPARRLPPPPVSTPPTGMGVPCVLPVCEVGVGVGVGVGGGGGVGLPDGDVVGAGVVGVGVGVLGVGVGVSVGVGEPLTGLGDCDGDWHSHGHQYSHWHGFGFPQPTFPRAAFPPAMPGIAGAFCMTGASAATAEMVAALAEGAAAAIAVPVTAAIRNETEIVISAECLTAEHAIRIALEKSDIPVLPG